ncbi:MAG: ABC transporter ATP-binding protein [Bacteroidales bacterium]|nr:ABC transporter ATP-binding protein [Bacteroidales bacterium]
MSIIEINSLTKVYNSLAVPVHALNGIDLSFEKGEFAAVVGPSGSGKTTLLNIVGGLDNSSSGKVTVDGINLENLSSSQLIDFRLRNIGFVFQAYNLIPVMTAMENVEFILQLQGKPKNERKERAEQLLTAVGLEERMHARPSKLSGGQQQRVAVARALASKPKFVLADEPTANLDSKSSENLLDIMEQLNKEENITFVFSTHDQRVVNKARRVVTIEDGKVKSDENKS